MEGDESQNEAIYVVFETKKEKLSADDIKKLVSWMHSYSDDKKDTGAPELLNCIIIVKGGATAIGKKVTIFQFNACFVCSNWMPTVPTCLKCLCKRSCSSILHTTSSCLSIW